MPLFDGGKTFVGKTVLGWLTRPKIYFNDCVDRLNCYVVPATLCFFIAVVSANAFGLCAGEPIRCLVSRFSSTEGVLSVASQCSKPCVPFLEHHVPIHGLSLLRREIGVPARVISSCVPLLLLRASYAFRFRQYCVSGPSEAFLLHECGRNCSKSMSAPTRIRYVFVVHAFGFEGSAIKCSSSRVPISAPVAFRYPHGIAECLAQCVPIWSRA